VGIAGVAPPLLALAPDGDEWSASCPGCFAPNERTPLLPTSQGTSDVVVNNTIRTVKVLQMRPTGTGNRVREREIEKCRET
jgi:hypothetical protein